MKGRNPAECFARLRAPIDQDRPLTASMDGFGPSSADFFVCCLRRTTAWSGDHEVRQDMLPEIPRIIESHGAEAAFPTTTVHVANPLQWTEERKSE